MLKSMRSIVVAYDELRTIGKDGDIPWAGKLPADMRFFRDLTEDRAVIMGRKTFESLPDAFRPLPNRQNIVISLSQKAMAGAFVVESIDEALEIGGENAYIIGGAQVYRQTLSRVNRVYATEIATRTEGGDTFFPELSEEEWQAISREEHEADERNKFAYSFVTYLRRHPIE